MNTPAMHIVGIGSSYGDDQAGWLAAEQLEIVLAPYGSIVDIQTAASPAELLDRMEHIDHLIVCDACRGLGRTGQIQRWTWLGSRLSAASWSGSHDLPLCAVFQLASQLNLLPPRVVIWSVEASLNEKVNTLSPEVAAAIPQLVHEIICEVKSSSCLREIECTNNRS